MIPDGLVEAPCPECATPSDLEIGPGCDVCEGTGRVLVEDVDVRTDTATPITESREDTRELREEAQGDAGEDAEQVRGAGRTFGGVSASEAASLRWEKERARNAELEQADHGDDIIVRTSVPVSTIVKRLSADAQKGDTRAARELRAWLAEVAVEARTSLEDLDERTRQSLLARLLVEIEEEEREHEPPADPLPGATPASAGVPSSTTGGPLVATEQAETHAASETSETDGAPS